jgi:hypothetical protein
MTPPARGVSQAEKEDWEAERAKLMREKLALEQQAGATDTLTAELERAVQAGEKRLGPRVAALLEAHRREQGVVPGATPARGGQRQGAPPKLMI